MSDLQLALASVGSAAWLGNGAGATSHYGHGRAYGYLTRAQPVRPQQAQDWVTADIVLLPALQHLPALGTAWVPDLPGGPPSCL